MRGRDRAAGRSTVMLLGRCVGPRRGKLGFTAGSLGLPDHAARNAARGLLQTCASIEFVPGPGRIRIHVVLRDKIP